MLLEGTGSLSVCIVTFPRVLSHSELPRGTHTERVPKGMKASHPQPLLPSGSLSVVPIV